MIIDKLKALLQPAKAKEEVPFLDQEALCRLVDTTLRGMGCTPKWAEEEDKSRVADFEFQSGSFVVRVTHDDPVLRLCFPILMTLDKEHIDLVREVCNQVNIGSNGLRAFYSFNSNHKCVNIHFFENLLLDPSRAKHILVRSMREMFSWRNVFIRWIDSVRDSQTDLGAGSPEEAEARRHRLICMIREHEMDFGEGFMSVRENPLRRITLSDWICEAMLFDDFVPSRLEITGEGLSLTMDASEDAQLRRTMADYALSDALISDGKFARRCATLQFVFFQSSDPDERRYLTLSLVAREASPEALFFQVTAVLAPRLATLTLPGDSCKGQPAACSLLMAYDLKDEKQLRDEFHFMWNDAKDKLSHGQMDDLSEEQRVVVRVTSRSLAASLYRGSQLFQSSRFFEAMLLLRNAFILWGATADRLPAKERAQFYELCFMLGYCYDEMGQYSLGYYYLSLLDVSDNMPYVREMVNNLANNNDPRALHYIESLLTDIRRHVEEQTGDKVDIYQAALHPDYRDFACFLITTRITILALRGCYDEAEKELQALGKYPALADLVTKGTHYLRQQRSRDDDPPFSPSADF